MEDQIMKKIFFIACAFAAVFACQKQEFDQPAENEGVTVPLKITADIAQTKTTMTNVDGVLKSAWKDGDKIYVTQCRDETYDNECVEYVANVSDEGVEFAKNSEANFSGPGGYAASRVKLYAMYPVILGNNRVNNKTFKMSEEQTQLTPGDLSHIENDNILVALPVEVDWTASPVSANFTFRHALSVLELDLKATAAGVKISKIIVEVTGGAENDYLVVTNGSFNLQNSAEGSITKTSGLNSMTLNMASLVELPVEDYAKFYMTIAPGHAGQTFNVKVVTDMGETLEVGSMKVPESAVIPQGAKAFKAFTVQAPEKEEIDYASAIDLSANATANTYIVNAPNTVYKFNAQVMGNGVVPTKMAEIVTSTELAPKTVLSLWYTCKQTSTKWIDAAPVDATSITLKDGYIYFKTPETFVNGNIVIAAFAEEGLTYSNITVNENREFTNATVLWSWDIWAVEGYNPETTKIDMEGYSVMDRNLGALVGLNDADAASNMINGVWMANAQGNNYEFGRKDPFPGFAEYPAHMPLTFGEKLLTTPAYTLITALQMNGIGTSKSLNNQMFGTSAASCTSVADIKDLPAIGQLSYVNRNPHKDISMAGTTYNWQNGELANYWKDMWGGESASAPSYKTIYDPCPAGWKIWDYNTLENFSIANASTAVTLTDDQQTCLGINVAGSLFPFNGGARGYSFELDGFGSLLNCNNGSAAPISFYSSSPYYYHTGMNKFYWGNYVAVSNWRVVVTAEGLVLEMIGEDEDNENRQYVIAATSYTAKAKPLRCIKE